MELTIEFDDSLIQEAMQLAQISDPEELIKLALADFVQPHHRASLLGLVGRVRFRDDFDHKIDWTLSARS